MPWKNQATRNRKLVAGREVGCFVSVECQGVPQICDVVAEALSLEGNPDERRPGVVHRPLSPREERLADAAIARATAVLRERYLARKRAEYAGESDSARRGLGVRAERTFRPVPVSCLLSTRD